MDETDRRLREHAQRMRLLKQAAESQALDAHSAQERALDEMAKRRKRTEGERAVEALHARRAKTGRKRRCRQPDTVDAPKPKRVRTRLSELKNDGKPAADGRDRKGRFVPGNQEGKRPRRSRAALDRELRKIAKPHDRRAVWEMLTKCAKAGEGWAVREFLERTRGKSRVQKHSAIDFGEVKSADDAKRAALAVATAAINGTLDLEDAKAASAILKLAANASEGTWLNMTTDDLDDGLDEIDLSLI